MPHSHQHVLGIVGQLASGKGTIVEYILQKHQGVSFRFSHILQATLDQYDIEPSRENYQMLSTILRKQFGENILSQAMTKLVRGTTVRLVVVDGVRRLTDIEQLSKLPHWHLIAVTADENIRYQRYISRDQYEGDEAMTLEQFRGKNNAEADYEVPAVMQQAEFTIINDGDLTKTYQQVDSIITQIDARAD